MPGALDLSETGSAAYMTAMIPYRRLQHRGLRDTLICGAHVAWNGLRTCACDLWYGRKLCRSYPNSNKERIGHSIVRKSPAMRRGAIAGFGNVRIVHAHAEKIANQWPDAIVYLALPFSVPLQDEFEQALRGTSARIVYCMARDLSAFDNPAWSIKLVEQDEPDWRQHRCAYITPRRQ